MRRTRQCCIFRSRKAINQSSGNRFGIYLRNLRPWLFLAPSLAGTAVFVLIPFVNVVVRSFFQAVGGRFVGLANFRLVLESQAFLLAVFNTLRFILVCIPVLMAFSLWVSILMTGAADSRSLYKTTILLPMAIPVASVVLLWKLLFYPQGILDQLAVWAGGREQDWLNQGSAFYILVLTYIWKNTGYDMMLWLAGLDGIPKELFEAAKVDGAGSWQSFFHIALPGLKSTAFLVLVLSVINSFKVFREAYLIAGGYPDDSIYMLQHLFNNWYGNLDVDKMCAGAVMMAILVFILILLMQKIMDRGERI